MTTYTTLPQDDENLEITLTEDSDLVTLNIQPAAVSITSAVTSVNGEVGIVTLDTDDIPEGVVNLYTQQPNGTTDDVTFNSVTADFFGVQHFTAKAIEPITAGQPVYISGHSGNTPEVGVADWDDSTKMPAFGIASADIATNNNGAIATYGDLKQVDTTGTDEGETWSVGDTLYVNASKLTNQRPSLQSQYVQAIAKVIRVHANVGQMFLTGAGRVNDIPNLSHNHVFIGNTTGYDARQLDTSDITEDATNLFYTDARADARVDLQTGANLDLSQKTTSDLTEGTNLYYTTTRANTDFDTRLATKSTSDLTEGSNLYYTDSRVQTVIDTNTAGFITASSTDTLTNKSGNISQWTNDAGYITEAEDNQTLSFTSPNLSISAGNSVDLSTLEVSETDGGTY